MIAYAVVLVLSCAAVAAWWLLLDAAYGRVKPAIERWVWHRVGGQGDPPKEGDDDG